MKAKFFFAAVGMVLAMAFTLSCSSDDGNESVSEASSSSGVETSSSSGVETGLSYGSLTYEGKEYRTIVIDSQTWLADNLDYAVEGSKCYDDDPANCAIYGRLYDWAMVMALPASCISNSCDSQINEKHRGICPEDWHVPSDDEWSMLINFVDIGYSAGKHLKAASGWNDYQGQSGNGEDTYGFAALPGGYARPNTSLLIGSPYYGVGTDGRWWASDEGNDRSALSRSMENSREGTLMGVGDKNYMHSVRCLKN
jgi:uncharacterized protein (TIGR02145 family)